MIVMNDSTLLSSALIIVSKALLIAFPSVCTIIALSSLWPIFDREWHLLNEKIGMFYIVSVHSSDPPGSTDLDKFHLVFEQHAEYAEHIESWNAVDRMWMPFAQPPIPVYTRRGGIYLTEEWAVVIQPPYKPVAVSQVVQPTSESLAIELGR